MEPKKSPHSQHNSQLKEESWRHHATQLQTILQGYSKKNQHTVGTRTDIESNGTEQRPEK